MYITGDGEGDTQQKKLLRELVRKDMISQGLGLLEKSNGLTAIPYLQVCTPIHPTIHISH